MEPGLVLGGTVLTSLLIIFLLFGGSLLTIAITVLYPTFKSVKALEGKGGLDEDKDWLTYWTVFGLFSLIDELFGFALQTIPFYFLVRLGFFVWLMHPQY